jgi:hypothetical protein
MKARQALGAHISGTGRDVLPVRAASSSAVAGDDLGAHSASTAVRSTDPACVALLATTLDSQEER